MSLPVDLRAELEAALGTRIENTRAVSGGCISNTLKLETSRGSAFLKWTESKAQHGIFRAEADSLHVISNAATVRVPAVVQVKDDVGGKYRWLLLEWLEKGAITKSGWEELGRGLAALHRVQSEQFGWPAANFIGSLPQSNERSTDWPAFWRDERIMPQLERTGSARGIGGGERRRIETMLGHIDELASAGNADGPSLLHGDLWSGNVHGCAAGTVAIIDPGSYYGHREVDLAMAALFGGFDQRFYEAYEEAWPLSEDGTTRRHLYQLYYLLVHVNLFGGGYAAQTMASVTQLGF